MPRENFPSRFYRLCFIFASILHTGFTLPLTSAQPASEPAALSPCRCPLACQLTQLLLAGARQQNPSKRMGFRSYLAFKNSHWDSECQSSFTAVWSESHHNSILHREVIVLPTIMEVCPRDESDPGRGRNPSLLQTACKPERARGAHRSNIKGKHMHNANTASYPAVCPQDQTGRMS